MAAVQLHAPISRGDGCHYLLVYHTCKYQLVMQIAMHEAWHALLQAKRRYQEVQAEKAQLITDSQELMAKYNAKAL